MDMNGIGALSAYTYQSSLAQTGNSKQALAQALTAVQSQVASTATLLGGSGTMDPLAAAVGASGSQSLTSLIYTTAASTGAGSSALQAMLSSMGNSTSALFAPSDALPSSAALLAPKAAAALARYAYDQSQNPDALAKQTATLAQQYLQSSGLNLLG